MVNIRTNQPLFFSFVNQCIFSGIVFSTNRTNRRTVWNISVRALKFRVYFFALKVSVKTLPTEILSCLKSAIVSQTGTKKFSFNDKSPLQKVHINKISWHLQKKFSCAKSLRPNVMVQINFVFDKLFSLNLSALYFLFC